MNYLTVQELCERLKVTRQCIYKWRKQGLPCYKINKAVRFDFSEVEKWIKERKENI